ncbi:uncharacterized protein PpBr36_10406, partial [Pyricularia pennisetigena]|uniref:uncharacterized protein n=1 Tax=Pyricularia pennisetigena TaxID=1578925 RepID=UPI00114D8EFC
ILSAFDRKFPSPNGRKANVWKAYLTRVLLWEEQFTLLAYGEPKSLSLELKMSALPFPALTPPSASETALASYEVRFRHPAYPRDTPPLLLLSAADGIGIEYDLAVISCCIICATEWDKGKLATKTADDNGNSVAAVGRDPARARTSTPSFLLSTTGVFHTIIYLHFGHNCNFPITFHHLHSGDGWLLKRGIGAVAYLVLKTPRNKHILFRHRKKIGLFQTGWRAVSTMDDDRKMLLLRRDVHYLFDGRRIAFVPKQFMSQPIQLIGHVLEPLNSMQLVHMYHNRNPQAIRGVSREFAFARFAWALFTDERIKFFGSHRLYKVLVWDSEQGRTETRDIEGAVVRSVAVVFDSSKRSQSRSVSPKKRSFAQAFGWGIEDSDEDGVSPESGEATQPQTFGWGQSAEDQCRGRTPFRRVRQGRKHSFGDISDGLSSVSSSQVETDIPVTPENKQAHGVDRPKRARKTPVTSDTTKSHFSDI